MYLDISIMSDYRRIFLHAEKDQTPKKLFRVCLGSINYLLANWILAFVCLTKMASDYDKVVRTWLKPRKLSLTNRRDQLTDKVWPEINQT